MKPKTISSFIMMGDSLSDRDTLYKRYLGGIISLGWVTGMRRESPLGRFTNGLAWSDHTVTTFINSRIIEEIQSKYHYHSDDISDAALNHDRHVFSLIEKSYNLDNNRGVSFENQCLLRSYCEGGLASYNYRWQLNTTIPLFFKRLILSTLGKKREVLLKEDKKKSSSPVYKNEALVIEWSA